MADKKKVLIVGNGSHVFINYTIEHIKNNYDILGFDLLLTNSIINPNFANNYENIYRSYSNNILVRIPLIRRFYIRFSILLALHKIKNHYDFVHIHYLDNNVAFYKRFKKIASKFVISIWGSDLYRSSGINLKRKIMRLKEADFITFTNEQTKSDFMNIIPNLDKKYKICRFGLETLISLKKINSTKSQSRLKLGIPQEKTIITIGYNLNPAQQHLNIIEQIIKLKGKNYYNDLFLVLPITYGSAMKSYKTELLLALEDSELNFKIFDEFLTEEDNAHLRNISDIMIQLQITDQFSGSMQEYMYCGNVIITGSWLPYQTLKENGVYYHTINEISELSVKLNNIIVNLENEKKNSLKNKELIYNISSWEENINNWINLYK